MELYKHQITVTILTDKPIENLDELPLTEIEETYTTGHWLGLSKIKFINQEIKGKQNQLKECKKLNNGGEFFDL
jgi:hypothetical protein